MRRFIKNQRNKGFYWLLLLPSVLFLIGFLVIPFVLLADLSFRDVDAYMNTQETYSFAQYAEVFSSSTNIKTVGITLIVAFITAILTLTLAYPAAYLLVYAKRSFVRTLLYIILITPLLTSMVVLSFAWIVILAQNGLINQILVSLNVIDEPLSMLWNMQTVIVAYIQVLLPFAVLPIATSLSDIDPSLTKASMSLGENRIRTFFRVILPLTIPGFIAGFIIVFSLAAGSYITPLLLGGRLLPLLPLNIYQQVIQMSNLPLAAALSFTLLAGVGIVVSFFVWMLNRWEARMNG
mgnify:CR=1 FL=1